MQLPREILIGDNVTDLTAEICKRLGFKDSAFLVTGEKTFEILGKKIRDILQDAGFKIECHIAKLTTDREVKSIEDKISEFKPEVVFGIGGGSKIDLAKFSSADLHIPFISVPSSASHDGIASPVASLDFLGKPYSVMAQSPIAIIVDTEIIINSPYKLIASGCGDVLAKFTAVRDWRLAHRIRNEYYGDYAANLAELGARHIVKNAKSIRPNDKEGLRILLEALISCGVSMGIAGSSRPCSGSEHLFSHALKKLMKKPPLHGESCGVGTILMAYLHGIDWREIRDTLHEVGAPTTAEELGIDPETIVEAILLARDVRPERFTILNLKKLNYREAKKIAVETGIIER
ncbi:NAD(P)-dependent glycerol-1-phosphate dehydrogenase [Candidatus Bathyarchaeota archaeon]|nr:NAD(P)-dependent glycerol-1-phosphate dehydrogenase [Candidatus Bathyarchaeota archaeon]